jgi:hypothetical protein
MDDDPILKPSETAAYLRVSERTLEGWRRRGVGPVFQRYGRAVLYRRSAIEAWLSECAFTNNQGGRPKSEPGSGQFPASNAHI